MNNKYGVVLAGGGSKGAYQIGAWKAMRELGIEFEAIAGVSIGSVNGALMTMGDFDNALKFWDSIAVDRGVKINEELADPDNLFSRKNWPALFKELLKNKGFDASPARDFFNEFIDEEAVRKSNVNLGIVTVKMTQGATPVQIFKDDIPEGQLVEYLLASADIPLAINVGPDGEKYLDGGAYDNTPINFMRSNGYNRLIVVDIASIRGLAHSQNLNNSEIVYIRPHNLDDLGASFDFSSEMNEKRMFAGYLDTKKAFSELLGNIFYFEPEVFRGMIKKYTADGMKQLEELAYKLKLEELKIYTEDEFISELKVLYEKDKTEKEESKKKNADEESTDIKGKVSDFLTKLAGTIIDNQDDETAEQTEEKKGRIAGVIEKITTEIIDGLEKINEEEPESEKDEVEEKKSTVSSVIDILKAKYIGETNFTLAEKILEEI